MLSALVLLTAGSAARKSPAPHRARVGSARVAASAKHASAGARRPDGPKAAAAPTEIPLPKAALGPPPASLPADAATKDADLVVDFSSNWQGYLEPCG